jgi:HK97 family phage prohead protease
MRMLNKKAIDLNVKSLTEDGKIEGYLNTFDHIDRIGDNTQKGAFSKSIKRIKDSGNVLPMLFGHNHEKVAGVWTEIYEDEKGLYGKGQLNLDTQLGQELYSNIKMGAIKGISIGYFEVDTEFDSKSGSKLLKELDLIEASIVLLPCNEQSQVEVVKSMNESGEKPTKTQLEKALKELGFSRKNSKTIIAEGYKTFYEDGKVETVSDIYSFLWSKVDNLTPEELRILIDMLNEFSVVIEKQDEEEKTNVDNLSEKMEETLEQKELEISKKQSEENIESKLDSLLEALKKS